MQNAIYIVRFADGTWLKAELPDDPLAAFAQAHHEYAHPDEPEITTVERCAATDAAAVAYAAERGLLIPGDVVTLQRKEAPVRYWYFGTTAAQQNILQEYERIDPNTGHFRKAPPKRAELFDAETKLVLHQRAPLHIPSPEAMADATLLGASIATRGQVTADNSIMPPPPAARIIREDPRRPYRFACLLAAMLSFSIWVCVDASVPSVHPSTLAN